MKKSLISAAVFALGASIVRARTHDVAFTYRMGAGFPGDVNRMHPASIVPSLMDPANPISLYGSPAIINSATNTVRGVLASDQATVTSIAGILVRPFPTQQTVGGSNAVFGAATPPVTGICDIIEDGFVIVLCPDFAVNPPFKGAPAFVWAAATAGNKILGGFVALTGGASSITLSNAEFNGPPDAAGVCELRVWKAKKT